MLFRIRAQNVRVAFVFKKKPVSVEAVPIDKEESVDTLEGRMTGKPGDWKITGVEGEQYFCAKDIFKKTYEPTDAESKKAWEQAYEGTKTAGQPVGYGFCPSCGAPGVSRCRCRLSDTKCANGHEWHFFNGQKHLGPSNHADASDHMGCRVVEENVS